MEETYNGEAIFKRIYKSLLKYYSRCINKICFELILLKNTKSSVRYVKSLCIETLTSLGSRARISYISRNPDRKFSCAPLSLVCLC